MTDAWVLTSLILITLASSLVTQLINYKMIDQKAMTNYKKKLKELQNRIKGAKDPKEITAAQTEMMEINSSMMKLSFKPLMITIIPLWVMFFLLQKIYLPYGDMLFLPITLPIFGSTFGWLGTYIIFSMIFSFTLKPIINKIGEKHAKTKRQDN